MRRQILGWMVLALVVGCSRTPAPRPMVHPAPMPLAHAGGSGVDGSTAGAGNQPAVLASYQGRTASQWAALLTSPAADPVDRLEAVRALGELGENGYRPLLEGLQSFSDSLRLASMQAISKTTLVQHEAETLPLLRAMLRDKNPEIRKSAAARIHWYGKTAEPIIPLLRFMAENDPDPAVQRLAGESIEFIDEAVTGIINAGDK